MVKLSPMKSVLIKNASVLDVRAGQILQNKHLLIKDGIIERISDGHLELENTKIIDIGGRILMPGLCDGHVHVNAVTADLAALRTWTFSYLIPQSIHIMEDMLMRGFTTVRDAGGADWGLAKAVEEGYIKSPRIIYGGPALSPTGGHGDSRQKGDNTGTNLGSSDLSIVCDGVTEVRKACRDQIRKGAHHIKIMVSGGVASPTDRIDSLQFSEEEIRATVEEAESANLYVLAHAYTARAINRALELGVRSIEHGNLLDEESVSLFLKHDAFLVPTLITYYALAEEGLSQGLPEDSYSKLSTVLENGKNAIKLAYENGVKMVYGTDLLGDMQRRQLEEFRLLGEIIPAIDVIRSATITAAELLNMEGQIGEIIPGAKADLLVSDGNPLEDLEVLQDPEKNLKLIMKDGVIYKNTLD